MPNTPTVALASDHIETYAAETGRQEMELWRAVLHQAEEDLLSPNERIRADAIAFYQGPDLLRVLDFAGISRDDAPWLRSRAEELAEVPSELRQRNVRLITYQGQTHSLTEWAELTGINVTTLCHRLRHGWSTARALSTPRRH